ncbi:MAG TPA: dimethyladenosine transferase [Lentisphaeria bacterium]|nr:MAG: dimethyladenosine transferase [Lentisphaerae bacterium GWF2_38_69]HBM16851.1 dimethyladenosine transferase [Lentisphaeria bacterium]
MRISVILYENFETLDVFGPVEAFGKVDDFSINFYSLKGGLTVNRDNLQIQTRNLNEALGCTDILFIPGGWGTREEIKNKSFIDMIQELGKQAEYILSVCTGSAILAKTNLLDGRKATSNKRAFDFPASLNNKVNWIKKARWVEDGNIFTSSGISAGTDMALAFIAKLKGAHNAKEIASIMEYKWNNDPDCDEFSSFAG